MKRDAANPALGARAFAAITAVEGLKLSAESKRRLKALRATPLSAAERRAEIVSAYKSAPQV